MHAPFVIHIIYVTADNIIMYQENVFTVAVNVVISSFHFYWKSLFTGTLVTF